jgi:hypothetical protein
MRGQRHPVQRIESSPATCCRDDIWTRMSWYVVTQHAGLPSSASWASATNRPLSRRNEPTAFSADADRRPLQVQVTLASRPAAVKIVGVAPLLTSEA